MNEFLPEGRKINSIENKRGISGVSALMAAQASGEILEGKALMCDEQHNLLIDLGGIRGIIPREEGAIGIAEGLTRDIALISRVGKAVCFVVDSVKNDVQGECYAVLSRRKAQERCKEHLLSKATGDIIDATVTHLESFGAFCDIGCGNVALLPIDSISVSRISHPKDRFDVGDNIRVIIKNIAADGKITLSHKELLGTWTENAMLFSQGQTVSGIIRSVEEYGVFVELTANLTGLAEPRADAKVGQMASVYIKSIIPEKMKIKLIIIDSFDTDYKGAVSYFYHDDKICDFKYSPCGSQKQIYSQF